MNYVFWLAIGMACSFAPKSTGVGVMVAEIACIVAGSLVMTVLKVLFGG